MIVLDTNVISEITKPDADSRVVEWFGMLSMRKAAITAVTVGEIWDGLVRMDDGNRKRNLIEDTESLLQEFFSGRVLPYDYAAAMHFAVLSHHRRTIGREVDKPDAQIAAICVARGFALATRNTRDFEFTGVKLINPWGD
ncbi:type II toxin-antitoxin system VapC family toxin [Glycomyces salinus]|uniref:type II toxin-antitoxin system VapC family toxin n=1 Tax=Glycomyces salinus TaxID=980294 RepID=UPI0018ECB33A|nr:type II toxin-antitoxin system VapC family toxin [Glycomyces salinus]